MSDDLDELKQKMRATWMAGDLGMVAQFTASAADEFVSRLAVTPGIRVLDVACGTGNLAIPAARRGAQVTGIDFAPNQLAQARQRAASESLSAIFEEGDAEQLNQPDESFDLVMTMFGAMFAPRPDRVSRELARVCRRGGRIAMANWTPEGFVGNLFELAARYVPPPEGIPVPILWGDEDVVRERLREHVSELNTSRHLVVFDYPFSESEVVNYYRNYFGPLKVQFSRLDQKAQAAYASELVVLWRQYNEDSTGRTVVEAEYLEVVATR